MNIYKYVGITLFEYANGDRNALCDLHLYDTEMDKNVNKNILLYNNAVRLLWYGMIF